MQQHIITSESFTSSRSWGFLTEMTKTTVASKKRIVKAKRTSKYSKRRLSSGIENKKNGWCENEDKILKELVKESKENEEEACKWSQIAESITGRSGKQCRERWHNHLRPDVKKGEWTVEEDEIIFNMQKSIGNQWSKITEHLPNRTDNDVKNRWHSKRRTKSRSNSVMIDVPTVPGKTSQKPTSPTDDSLMLYEISVPHNFETVTAIENDDEEMSETSNVPSLVEESNDSNNFMSPEVTHDRGSMNTLYSSAENCKLRTPEIQSFFSESIIPTPLPLQVIAMKSPTFLTKSPCLPSFSTPSPDFVGAPLLSTSNSPTPSDWFELAEICQNSPYQPEAKANLSGEKLTNFACV